MVTFRNAAIEYSYFSYKESLKVDLLIYEYTKNRITDTHTPTKGPVERQAERPWREWQVFCIPFVAVPLAVSFCRSDHHYAENDSEKKSRD